MEETRNLLASRENFIVTKNYSAFRRPMIFKTGSISNSTVGSLCISLLYLAKDKRHIETVKKAHRSTAAHRNI